MSESIVAALIQARCACAMIRLEGMKAANLERLDQGLSIAYGEAEMLAVIEEEGIHHNAVYTLIGQHRS